MGKELRQPDLSSALENDISLANLLWANLVAFDFLHDRYTIKPVRFGPTSRTSRNLVIFPGICGIAGGGKENPKYYFCQVRFWYTILTSWLANLPSRIQTELSTFRQLTWHFEIEAVLRYLPYVTLYFKSLSSILFDHPGHIHLSVLHTHANSHCIQLTHTLCATNFVTFNKFV